MADPAQIQQIELAADMVLGGAGDPAQRRLAEQHLMSLGQDLSSIPLLQSVLDQSANSLAITAAAISLSKLVTEHWNSFTETMRVQIRACNFLCAAHAGRGCYARGL